MFSGITTRLLQKSVAKASIKPKMLTALAQRGFYKDLGLESHALEPAGGDHDTSAIEFWKEHEGNTSLALKTHDQIRDYILDISRSYFRTTKKASLTIDSNYKDHGLDSFDLIELVIQVEDDLGYVIDAENLAKFQKPKHFVNFINQIEAYKEEFGKLPHEGKHASASVDDIKGAFPWPPVGGDKHH